MPIYTPRLFSTVSLSIALESLQVSHPFRALAVLTDPRNLLVCHGLPSLHESYPIAKKEVGELYQSVRQVPSGGHPKEISGYLSPFLCHSLTLLPRRPRGSDTFPRLIRKNIIPVETQMTVLFSVMNSSDADLTHVPPLSLPTGVSYHITQVENRYFIKHH